MSIGIMSKPAEIALWGLDVAEMTVSHVALIVFLVDATDSKSFSKSKSELNSLLTDKAISDSKPILVLVQRPDPSDIANEEILVQELCLEEAIANVCNFSWLVWPMYEPLSRLVDRSPSSHILCLLSSSKDTRKVRLDSFSDQD